MAKSIKSGESFDANQRPIDALILQLEGKTDEQVIRKERLGDLGFEPLKQALPRLRRVLDAVDTAFAEDASLKTFFWNNTEHSQHARQTAQELLQILHGINSFGFGMQFGSQTPAQHWTDLVQRFATKASAFGGQIRPHVIEYLKSGDPKEAIEEAKKALEKANQTLAAAQELASKQAAIGGTRATAPHAKAFAEQADTAATGARRWLITSAVLIAATFLFALYLYLNPWGSTGFDAIFVSAVVARLLLLSVLFFAAIKAGQIYFAMRHQETVLRHKAIALNNFELMSTGSYMPEVQNAVLMEAARAIYSIASSGFETKAVDEAGSSHVVEVFRAAGGKG